MIDQIDTTQEQSEQLREISLLVFDAKRHLDSLKPYPIIYPEARALIAIGKLLYALTLTLQNHGR